MSNLRIVSKGGAKSLCPVSNNIYKSRENKDLYKKEEVKPKKETPKYEYTKIVTETKETKTNESIVITDIEYASTGGGSSEKNEQESKPDDKAKTQKKHYIRLSLVKADYFL